MGLSGDGNDGDLNDGTWSQNDIIGKRFNGIIGYLIQPLLEENLKKLAFSLRKGRNGLHYGNEKNFCQ